MNNEVNNSAHVTPIDGVYSYVSINRGRDRQNVKDDHHIYELDEHPQSLYELDEYVYELDEHVYELDWVPYNYVMIIIMSNELD